jgi:hypothetical protein
MSHQQQPQSSQQRPPATDPPAAGQLGASAVSAEGGKPSIWAGFYKKTILERQDQVHFDASNAAKRRQLFTFWPFSRFLAVEIH